MPDRWIVKSMTMNNERIFVLWSFLSSFYPTITSPRMHTSKTSLANRFSQNASAAPSVSNTRAFHVPHVWFWRSFSILHNIEDNLQTSSETFGLFQILLVWEKRNLMTAVRPVAAVRQALWTIDSWASIDFIVWSYSRTTSLFMFHLWNVNKTRKAVPLS